jgi:hypothetical protein
MQMQDMMKNSSLEREGLAANGSDPRRLGAGVLPGHDAASPALRRRLRNARRKLGLCDEAVGRIGRARGLADHELVDVDARSRNLEERGTGEGAAGGIEQALAVVVHVLALVVELDVVLRMTELAGSTRGR